MKNKKTKTNSTPSPSLSKSKYIASPNLQSKFTPMSTIAKSPTLSAQTNRSENKGETNKKQAFDFLMKLSGKEDLKRIDCKNLSSFQNEIKSSEYSTQSPVIKIPISRKTVIDLKDLDNFQTKETKEYTDLPITPAFSIKKTLTLASNHSDKKEENNLINVDIIEADQNDFDSHEEETVKVKHEGFIYKLTDTKRVKKPLV